MVDFDSDLSEIGHPYTPLLSINYFCHKMMRMFARYSGVLGMY